MVDRAMSPGEYAEEMAKITAHEEKMRLQQEVLSITERAQAEKVEAEAERARQEAKDQPSTNHQVVNEPAQAAPMKPLDFAAVLGNNAGPQQITRAFAGGLAAGMVIGGIAAFAIIRARDVTITTKEGS